MFLYCKIHVESTFIDPDALFNVLHCILPSIKADCAGCMQLSILHQPYSFVNAAACHHMCGHTILYVTHTSTERSYCRFKNVIQPIFCM